MVEITIKGMTAEEVAAINAERNRLEAEIDAEAAQDGQALRRFQGRRHGNKKRKPAIPSFSPKWRRVNVEASR